MIDSWADLHCTTSQIRLDTSFTPFTYSHLTGPADGRQLVIWNPCRDRFSDFLPPNNRPPFLLVVAIALIVVSLSFAPILLALAQLLVAIVIFL